MAEIADLTKGILDLAKKEAEEIRNPDPEIELGAWILEAREREMMVSVAYSHHHVKRYHNSLIEQGYLKEFADQIARSIYEVWSQEYLHVTWLNQPSVISFSDRLKPSRREKFQRDFRGMTGPFIMRGLIDPEVGRFWHWAALVGRQMARLFPMRKDPQRFLEFLGKLDTLDSFGMEGFCRVNEAFETTAVEGYKRMRELVQTLLSTAHKRDVMISANHTVAVTLQCEMWHEEHFGALAWWCGDQHHLDPKRRTADLLHNHLERIHNDRFGVRVAPSMVVSEGTRILEKKWRTLVRGEPYVALGPSLDEPHFLVLLNVGRMDWFLPKRNSAQSLAVKSFDHPTLTALSRAMGSSEASVTVSWTPSIGPPQGLEPPLSPDHVKPTLVLAGSSTVVPSLEAGERERG